MLTGLYCMPNNITDINFVNKKLEEYSKYYDKTATEALSKLNKSVADGLKELQNKEATVFQINTFLNENKIKFRQIKTFKEKDSVYYVIEVSYKNETVQFNVLSSFSFLFENCK